MLYRRKIKPERKKSWKRLINMFDLKLKRDSVVIYRKS